MSVIVQVAKTGFLRFRVYHAGREAMIGTKYRDDGARGRNRRLCETKAVLLADRLASAYPLHKALLDVLGVCPTRLIPNETGHTKQPGDVTVRDHYAMWIARCESVVKRSTYRRRVRAFKAVLLPAIGDVALRAIDARRLKNLQAELVGAEIGPPRRRRMRSIKAARNLIGWHLKALWNDAADAGIVDTNPFRALRWPRTVKPKPDPFTEADRDAIVAWLAEGHPHWAPWVGFLFWTGMRHGEAAALTWGDVDLERGTASITKSRDEHADGAPKTSGSVREIELLQPALDAIEALARPLHATESDRVFVSPQGKPVTDFWWPKRIGWYAALRALEIRPRKFYATRHTFISWALSNGMNPQALAEYVGSSLAMIMASYGRFIRTDSVEPLRRALSAAFEQAKTGRKPETRRVASAGASDFSSLGMEAGGIEAPSPPAADQDQPGDPAQLSFTLQRRRWGPKRAPNGAFVGAKTGKFPVARGGRRG